MLATPSPRRAPRQAGGGIKGARKGIIRVGSHPLDRSRRGWRTSEGQFRARIRASSNLAESFLSHDLSPSPFPSTAAVASNSGARSRTFRQVWETRVGRPRKVSMINLSSRDVSSRPDSPRAVIVAISTAFFSSPSFAIPPSLPRL